MSSDLIGNIITDKRDRSSYTVRSIAWSEELKKFYALVTFYHSDLDNHASSAGTVSTMKTVCIDENWMLGYDNGTYYNGMY